MDGTNGTRGTSGPSSAERPDNTSPSEEDIALFESYMRETVPERALTTAMTLLDELHKDLDEGLEELEEILELPS